jgi:transcriptional regulator with XRE-family HTH domain
MEELGDKINTTKGYIFRVEKGELIPGREKLMGLADEFKLDRNKILKIAIEDAMDRAIKRIEDKYYVYKE